jgi:hypothetical protein
VASAANWPRSALVDERKHIMGCDLKLGLRPAERLESADFIDALLIQGA